VVDLISPSVLLGKLEIVMLGLSIQGKLSNVSDFR
jgi:hypothetical protein